MMNKQHVFPSQVLAEGMSEPLITLERQKVVVDKKVSLLPADIRKVDHKKNHGVNRK